MVSNYHYNNKMDINLFNKIYYTFLVQHYKSFGKILIETSFYGQKWKLGQIRAGARLHLSKNELENQFITQPKW